VLGKDFAADLEDAKPLHWGTGTALPPASLPEGSAPLASHVTAPRALAASLGQIGSLRMRRPQQPLRPRQSLVNGW